MQTAGGLGVFQESRQVEDMPAVEFISPLIKRREQQHDEVLSDLFCESKIWASFKSCAVYSLQFTALLHTVQAERDCDCFSSFFIFSSNVYIINLFSTK